MSGEKMLQLKASMTLFRRRVISTTRYDPVQGWERRSGLSVFGLEKVERLVQRFVALGGSLLVVLLLVRRRPHNHGGRNGNVLNLFAASALVLGHGEQQRSTIGQFNRLLH